MSVEAIHPAERHLDELIAGLVACALRGRLLAEEISELQQQHTASTLQQIQLSGEVDTFLERECQDAGYREYLKGCIADRIRAEVYPEQRAAGAEPPSTPPELYVVPDEG